MCAPAAEPRSVRWRPLYRSNAIVANPRLIDVFGSDFTQSDVDFAIPRLNQDIPLYIDPFLLWASDRPEHRDAHALVVKFMHQVAEMSHDTDVSRAAAMLAGCREEPALGLGYGVRSRRGTSLGPELIATIIAAHRDVPQLAGSGLRHLEELQLVVPGFAEDRVSDVTASIVLDTLLRYTEEAAARYRIPTRESVVGNCFDDRRGTWLPSGTRSLPFNPLTGAPLILVPLNLLRHLPWINYNDYYSSSYAPQVLRADARTARIAKEAVLRFNARNYREVERYVDHKEARAADCKPDPLFVPLSSITLRTRIDQLKALPTGRDDGADRRYEDWVTDVLVSSFYPTLELAENRVRTVSGAHIRDLLFYNDGKTPFWHDLRDRYQARQPVFELKNVKSLEPDHVDQLYRYLDSEFGRFGVLVSRYPAPPAVQRNLVDLHSSKRVVIICLDDRDLELLVAMLESGRDPTEVCKKKFVEFTRLLPK